MHLGRRLALWLTPAVGVDLVWWCRCVRGKECSQGSSQGSQVCVSRDRCTWRWQIAPSPPYTDRHQVPGLPDQPGKHNRSLLGHTQTVICHCTFAGCSSSRGSSALSCGTDLALCIWHLHLRRPPAMTVPALPLSSWRIFCWQAC